MYKLKNSYIDQMIAHHLTNAEIDFLLYIAVSQDESGRVESVYYRDVCYNIHISVQKFYDVIHSLENKGLISVDKSNPRDIGLILTGNSFVDYDYESRTEKAPWTAYGASDAPSAGYLNVAENDFRSEKFTSMMAGSKLFYLYSQRFMNGKHMLVSNFYDKYCELFNVSRKRFQIYIHELKKNKLLFVSRKRNTSLHYEMTFRRSTVIHRKSCEYLYEKDYYVSNITSLIVNNFRKFIPEKGGEFAARNIARLADSKRAENCPGFISKLMDAVRRSIHIQKQEKREPQILNAALVNKCLTEDLRQSCIPLMC